MLTLSGSIKIDLQTVRFFDIIIVLSKDYMRKVELMRAVWSKPYETKEQALEAWNEGVDFKIPRGPYCSNRDVGLLKTAYDHVYLTYGAGDLVRVL